MQISIRDMTIEDVEAVHKISVECFGSQSFSKGGIAYELTSPIAITLVAFDGDTPMGFVNAKTILGECYINNIGVTSSYRRRGIAKLLLDRLILISKLNNNQLITLEVRRSNHKAIALYEGYNFVLMGSRGGFYSDPVEDGLIYTLMLNKEDNA